MPPRSKRVLPGKRYPLNMRTTKELRDKIEEAAMASGRSLVQEVEFRLERSFRQQEIEKEIKKTLEARLDSFRDEISKNWNDRMDEMMRAMRITPKQLTLAQELSDLIKQGSNETKEPDEWPKDKVTDLMDRLRERASPPDEDTSQHPNKKEGSK